MLDSSSKHETLKDALLSWVLVQQKQNVRNAEDILGIYIWYNTKLLKENKPFLYSHYIKKGIIFIGYFLDDEGNILNLVTFKRKYDVQTHEAKPIIVKRGKRS